MDDNLTNIYSSRYGLITKKKPNSSTLKPSVFGSDSDSDEKDSKSAPKINLTLSKLQQNQVISYIFLFNLNNYNYITQNFVDTKSTTIGTKRRSINL